MTLFKRLSVFLLVCFLSAQPLFVLAQTPNDPSFDALWYLEHIGSTNAWETTTGSDEVVIAVLDTGVDIDHPDLLENIWMNEGEVPDDGIDNDENGFVDDVYGWDFVREHPDPSPDTGEAYDQDAVPHGTMIAGVISAVGDNAEGVVGLSWNSKIMSLRVMDNFGSGFTNHAADAVLYAVENGADIINLSFAGYEFDDAFRLSLKEAYEAGVVIVAAAGNLSNGGLNMNREPVYPICYGAQQDEDWVLGVVATDREDQKAEFSNYGQLCADIAAPGVDFYSTAFYDENWEAFSTELYLDEWSGTSLAAPVVSGAAALLLSAYPSLTPKQVYTILKLSVDPVIQVGEVSKRHMGSGRVSVANAFQIAGAIVGASQEEEVAAVSSEELSPSTNIVVVPEGGDPPLVRVFSKAGELVTSFLAYEETFGGGVRVAVGDIDGDFVDEIVVVPGPGRSGLVKIFEQDGMEVGSFTAFDDASGYFVATGDIDGDQIEEVLVSTDAGGVDSVRSFEVNGFLLDEWKLSESVGVSIRVATADVDGDGIDEVVTSFGEGYGPVVRVLREGRQIAQFLAYAETYENGVFVAAGDINNDGKDEIVTGTDAGGGPHVQIFTAEGSHLGTFFAYGEEFRGGVRVSVGNLSDDLGGTASIIAAAGPGGGPHIRVFNDRAELIGTFFTDDEADRHGINVGAWSY